MANSYKVFVAHSSVDTWVANQMATAIHSRGACTFLDDVDIHKGDDFKRIIKGEVASSNELIALFTPWAAKRTWIWTEIGAAWGQGKRIIAVFHGMILSDLGKDGSDRSILEDVNVLQLNDMDRYLEELEERVKRGLP